MDYDIDKYAAEMENPEELIKTANSLELYNPESILKMGLNTAMKISKLSDMLLNIIGNIPEGDSEVLLGQLNDILKDYHKIYLSNKRSNIFNKLMNTVIGSAKPLYKHYSEIGNEIDKFYVRLKQYESEIRSFKHTLNEMYEEYIKCFQQLELNIQVGKLVLSNWTYELKSKENYNSPDSTNETKHFDNTEGYCSIGMLEQRIHDLLVSKTAVLQTIYQIENIQIGNNELIKKINSALISTIPMFRQSILEIAAYEKQYEINILEIETLENAWETINSGIDEAMAIQQNIKQKRIEGIKKLREFQQKIK